MSKGNMLLGHARGKVGDLVFSRVNGQQVTRARAAVVKNPKTEKQVIQRIILNTIAQGYSRMLEITDHSFEGVPTGARSMAKFMKLNMDSVRQRISDTLAAGNDYDAVACFSPIGSNVFSMLPYIVSRGSLPEQRVTAVGQATQGGVDAELSFPMTQTAAGEGTWPTLNATYGDVAAALGVNMGDQLTFIAIGTSASAEPQFHFARVILQPSEVPEGLTAETTPFFKAVLDADGVPANGFEINSPSDRNEGNVILGRLTDTTGYFVVDATENTFEDGIKASYTTHAAGVIVSRQKVDGSWARSNCQLYANTSSLVGIAGQWDLLSAVDLFYSKGFDIGSDLYLNNAQD